VETASEIPVYVGPPGASGCEPLSMSDGGCRSALARTSSGSLADSVRLAQFVDAAERYRAKLIWVATRVTNRREDAEDIVQQALMNAFRKLSGFRGDSHIRTWLTAIVQNAAHEHIRKQRGRSFVPLECSPFSERDSEDLDLPDGSMNQEEYYASCERDRIVAATIGGMGPRNREVLKMCVVEELPYLQVATLLGISLSNVSLQTRFENGDLESRWSI